MKQNTVSKTKPTPGGWTYHPMEICLSGYSGSGKTTLARALIQGLGELGMSCGFVKHDAHFFQMDTPGKDTHQAKTAGAQAVFIQDPTHSATIQGHGPMGPSQSQIEQAMNPLNCLLVEGNKQSNLPKLLLLDPRHEIDDEIIQGDFNAVLALIYPAGDQQRAEALVTRIAARPTPNHPEPADQVTSPSRSSDGSADLPHPTIICRDDHQEILNFLLDYWRGSAPPVKALILGGGQSSRMGIDKTGLRYHAGLSQLAHTAGLADQALAHSSNSVRAQRGEEKPGGSPSPGNPESPSSRERPDNLLGSDKPSSPGNPESSGHLDSPGEPRVYLSLRPGQEPPPDTRGYPVLTDRFSGFGPLGGILTALHEDPHAAWLILSCDLPLLRAEDVQQLLAHRDIFQIATCFTGTDELPEPLCAIYEPKARPRLLSFLALGAQCPRWILRNGGAKLLTPTYARAVFNANTPEEYDEALALLKEN